MTADFFFERLVVTYRGELATVAEAGREATVLAVGAAAAPGVNALSSIR